MADPPRLVRWVDRDPPEHLQQLWTSRCLRAEGVSELEASWAAVHDALPVGWYVGRPIYHDERRECVLYAYDPSERPKVGLRSREWTAIAPTEEGVLRETARCGRAGRPAERGGRRRI